MPEIFGSFIEKSKCENYLSISFSPNSIPIQELWQNNGLSADFLADYWAKFFPAENKQAEIRDAICFISNELLENAMKFNCETSKCPIVIDLYCYPKELKFYVSNSVKPEFLTKFQDFIKKLLKQNTAKLYSHQLELNANNDNAQFSNIGLLTMINDYNARLAWKFKKIQQHEEITVVITMARLLI